MDAEVYDSISEVVVAVHRYEGREIDLFMDTSGSMTGKLMERRVLAANRLMHSCTVVVREFAVSHELREINEHYTLSQALADSGGTDLQPMIAAVDPSRPAVYITDGVFPDKDAIPSNVDVLVIEGN